jgi:hypothetical protein
MSGIYVPGSFSKKKEVLQPLPIHVEVLVEVPVEVHVEQIKKEEQKPQKQQQPKQPKPIIREIKPVEVKEIVWGEGKKNFAESLKIAGGDREEPDEFGKKNENEKIKGTEIKPFRDLSIVQKEVKKEELDFFMEKYNSKLRKLYDNAIYYDKEFFNKLRINGEQGYISFCKFMFYMI